MEADSLSATTADTDPLIRMAPPTKSIAQIPLTSMVGDEGLEPPAPSV